ncbi:MAG: hypothetical protein HY700_14290 [Gemmatimonadetes bacterium]|nr:hypothetical protein [Gemmatimonadota bacterium]
MRLLLLVGVVFAANPASAGAQSAVAPVHLEIKYLRDSEEYWILVQQIYRAARETVARAKDGVPRGAAWGVVLDVDETTLDNSVYQLDRGAYESPFDSASWNAWVRREEAGAVPGVVDFMRAVRAAGGRVAYVSNRNESTREATRRNLTALGLWQEGDRLCLETSDHTYTKPLRRAELRKGAGTCSWEGQPLTVVAYIGDQMGDFPSPGEEGDGSGGLSAFGVRYFLLPQPMYGAWTTRVTRPDGKGR